MSEKPKGVGFDLPEDFISGIEVVGAKKTKRKGPETKAERRKREFAERSLRSKKVSENTPEVIDVAGEVVEVGSEYLAEDENAVWERPEKSSRENVSGRFGGLNSRKKAGELLEDADKKDAGLIFERAQVFAETTYETCNKFDKHFITTQDLVREFNAWYEAGIADAQDGTQTQDDQFPNYKVPDIIKTWPAHGDVSLGQDFYLAPFYDFNGDGVYHWQDGDYPWHDIKKTKECSVDRSVSLYGDLNYWWVMNDKGNIHTETGADPIGMEIRAQAFAFAFSSSSPSRL